MKIVRLLLVLFLPHCRRVVKRQAIFAPRFLPFTALYGKLSRMKLRTDIVVVGAGHAGCEAALAAARLGCEALVVTLSLDAIAQMSCNPALGGLAKGQLVREIDALGGAMALAADATGIQFRMLNASKGPAVRGPRAQADKWAYQHWMKHYLERAERVRLLQDRVTEIIVTGGRVQGVRTAIGLEISCRAVVLAPGTFTRGQTHVGAHQAAGGRFGEAAAPEISASLRALGLPLMRLKTGTCPRVNARSVDFSRMEPQPGDEPPRPFSFLTEKLELEQVPCHQTWTSEKTHRIVAAALDRAPIFSGQIAGVGPRYCPSFELKVARFPDRRRHHIYVEPEGRDTEELYLNGLSTSLDWETQIAMVRSVPGLEAAEISRFGYAVEYDAVAPRALGDTLEVKTVKGLYCAGQLCGTSGYEEAAAQGLMAGANAALAVQQRPPFILARNQAYIGVLIDDIVTRGTDEPYRLFTSRAEHRLWLRQDNADLRLTPPAREVGLVDADRAARVRALQEEIETTQARLRERRHEGKTLAQHLKNPRLSWAEVAALDGTELAATSPRAAEQVEIEARYEGYIKRHLAEIGKVARSANLRLPEDFDYLALRGVSNEGREKLAAVRPQTLGQAARISGVSPADIALLAVRIKQARSAKSVE